jgi:transcriptional regulator with XRE-family HTH domain
MQCLTKIYQLLALAGSTHDQRRDSTPQIRLRLQLTKVSSCVMAAEVDWFSTERYAAQREEALRRFGRMLRNWRVRNGWTQYTSSKWGAEAGFPALAAGNLSNIEHGKQGNLRPSSVFQLADLNRRIAFREWGPVRSRSLRDQLEKASPITTDDGTPWGPTEFWAAYVGLLPIPKELDGPELEPAPVLTDDQARALCEQWRAELQQMVLTHDLDPVEALMELTRHAPSEHRRKLRQVLGAGALYTAQELLDSWDNQWMPAAALEQWKAKQALTPSGGGGGGSPLGKVLGA